MTSDIVPYVAHSIYCSDNIDSDKIHACLDPGNIFCGEHDEWLKPEEYVLEEIEDEDDLISSFTFNKWTCERGHDDGWDEDPKIFKKKRMGGYLFKKNKHRVWVVNESEYISAGVIEAAIVSDKPSSIKAFVKDWDLLDGDPIIDKDDTIEWSDR